MPDLLEVGLGERKERRNTHDGPLADAFEALTAAIYLDLGEDAMRYFLQEALATPLATVVASPPERDAKTRLQELLQSRGKPIPSYNTIEAVGHGHNQHFVVEVVAADGAVLGRGAGMSKRAAQTAAAEDALPGLLNGEGN